MLTDVMQSYSNTIQSFSNPPWMQITMIYCMMHISKSVRLTGRIATYYVETCTDGQVWEKRAKYMALLHFLVEEMLMVVVIPPFANLSLCIATPMMNTGMMILTLLF
jgi:hypothetical protein